MTNADNATSAKVKVSKEVAEAIEALRSGIEDYGYWRSIRQFEEKDDVDIRFVKTRDYFNEDLSLFMRAMFGDYEIEQTPAEKVAEYYAKAKRASEELPEKQARFIAEARVQTIEFVTKAYGLKIEGVNA